MIKRFIWKRFGSRAVDRFLSYDDYYDQEFFRPVI